MATARRIYAAVAKSVRREMSVHHNDNGQVQAIAATARAIASDFSDDNVRFRHDKFYEACGLNEQGYPYGAPWFGPSIVKTRSRPSHIG